MDFSEMPARQYCSEMTLCARLSPSELPGLPGSERMSGEPGSDGSSSTSSQSSGKKPPSKGPSKVNHGISCSPLALLLLLLALLLPLARAGDISCQGIRYIYFNKGLDTSNIPRSPQQGGNTTQLSAYPELLSLVVLTRRHSSGSIYYFDIQKLSPIFLGIPFSSIMVLIHSLTL